MIAFINGILISKEENLVVVDCNGIGYEIFVSSNTLCTLPLQGEKCKLLTYLQTREDGISLFGFISKEEKSLFLKLINISGIGPKNAINILSGYKLSDLIVYIAQGDVKMLSKIKGLGGKTAERIVLELKEKVDIIGFDSPSISNLDNDVFDEAVETLVSLGLTKNDAYTSVRKVANENSTVEDIIRKVLKGMG